MKLALARCTVRDWTAADVGGLVLHANDARVAANLRDRFPHPYTRRDAELWVQRAQHAVRASHFAIEVNGVAAGGIGVDLLDDVARHTGELGFWLGVVFWNQGIVTDVVRAFTAWAFAEWDVARLEALVFESNPASARVLEKCGFEREGRLRQSVTKHGQTQDAFLYARVRPPH